MKSHQVNCLDSRGFSVLPKGMFLTVAVDDNEQLLEEAEKVAATHCFNKPSYIITTLLSDSEGEGNGTQD